MTLESKLREGTEILRTGGGVTLTAAECNEALDRFEALEHRLHEIKMQATRRHRASDLKRYLEVDLERIERLASES